MPAVDAVAIGQLDLSGMLAVLSAKIEATKVRRIVFDSLDVLLNLLPDLQAERREINRLHSWLLTHKLTTIVTAKLSQLEIPTRSEAGLLQFFPFIVDCVVALTHVVENEFSRRRVRVIKYRGTSFSENETPFDIGSQGLEVATVEPSMKSVPVSTERVSTGIPQLDQMLFGGLMRGSTTMITGSPGTAKTTLAGAFAEAAGKRGERVTYIALMSPARKSFETFHR